MTPSTIGTPIEYPSIVLGGVKYELKFTEEILYYRLSKANLDLIGLTERLKGLATMCDMLHALIGPRFQGTAEDVAQMVLQEKKVAEGMAVIFDALGKVLHPPKMGQAAATDSQPQVQ